MQASTGELEFRIQGRAYACAGVANEPYLMCCPNVNMPMTVYPKNTSRMRMEKAMRSHAARWMLCHMTFMRRFNRRNWAIKDAQVTTDEYGREFQISGGPRAKKGPHRCRRHTQCNRTNLEDLEDGKQCRHGCNVVHSLWGGRREGGEVRNTIETPGPNIFYMQQKQVPVKDTMTTDKRQRVKVAWRSRTCESAPMD
jgi:hypothetical protein